MVLNKLSFDAHYIQFLEVSYTFTSSASNVRGGGGEKSLIQSKRDIGPTQ